MENEEAKTGASNSGSVRGVPGECVENTGLLDLRGTPPEAMSRLKIVRNVGLVLVDRGQTSALTNVIMENAGTVAEADPDERVVIGPNTDFNRAVLEGMEPGLRMTVIGIITFDPDIPLALLSEKIAFLRLIGIMIAPAGVQGALLGKMEHTGVSISFKAVGPVLKSFGETRITAGYLSYMKPGTIFLNLGETHIDPEITGVALSEKIVEYHNLGTTVASRDAIDWLQVNAPTQQGEFQTHEEATASSEQDTEGGE